MLSQTQARDPENRWVMPREGKASGLLRGETIRDGFGVAIADLTYQDFADHHQPGADLLKIQCKISGDSAISGEKSDYQPVHAGRISFLVQPHDSWKRERIELDTHIRSVTLMCSRDFASDLLGNGSNMPAAIRDFLDDRVSHFCFGSVPLPPRLRTIVEDMLQEPSADRLGRLMLEGRALELLSLSLHQILDVPAGTCNIRPKDLGKVRDICAILEGHPSSTLSNGELCKMVAWNETQMMECFKQVTGTTISNFRHQLRMDNARRQLHETDASITEIAFDAGYEHPSNFATAFKRTFGFPPKMARARRN